MADIFELFKKISAEKPTQNSAITHIVAGLGNPGEKYQRTRHNTGFMALDFLAEARGAGKFRLKFKAMCAECEIGGHRVLLMKPETFMNNSGEAIFEAASFYKIPPENIVVLVDDICLAPGVLRIRDGGSAGGHNGLKSIIECISSEKFPRVRIGVGEKPSPEYDLASWVLGEIPKADRELMFESFSRTNDALPLILDKCISDAMSRFNGGTKQAKTANDENGKDSE